MERTEVELYDRVGNVAVVRLPGRESPGIFIQGDSFSILAEDARRLAAAAQNDPTLRDTADDLARALGELLAYYASTLTDHGIPLPYKAD